MKGLILAAGLGTRLMPLTRRVPRCLIPIQDRPVIMRSIIMMRNAGITDILLDTCHLAHRVEEVVGDGADLGVNLQYLREADLGGIGEALHRACPLLGKDSFVVVNGDVIADLDLADVLDHHEQQGADATIVLRSDPDATRHGALDFDGDASLSALLGETADETGFLQAAGIRVLGTRIYDYLSPGRPCRLSDALADMVRSHCHMEGYLMDGYWSDLATWEKYGHVLWEIGRGFVPEVRE